MTAVNYPGRRQDIIGSLRVLMAINPATVGEWPGLTDAVHWLVDDTGWDLYHDNGDEAFNPQAAVGYLLKDAKEVAVINAVLEALLVVLGELGPGNADSEYLTHERWPEVAATARVAHERLTAG